MFAECSYTWGQFLRSLKLFCETAAVGLGRINIAQNLDDTKTVQGLRSYGRPH